MPIDINELLQSKNPYTQLDTKEKLKAYQDQLNTLGFDKKETLATHVVTNVPEEELTDYLKAVQSFIINEEDDDESFFYVLTNVGHVKKIIADLLDYANQEAYKSIFEAADILNQFKQPALNIMVLQECTIAENLALNVPKEERSRVSQSIHRIFPGSDLFQKIQETFILKREIEKKLLGDKPEEFFNSIEFKVDRCKLYSKLFTFLDQPLIEQIGERLFKAPERKNIQEKLESICSTDYPEANPFWRIKEHILTSIAAAKPAPLLSHNSSSIFKTQSTHYNEPIPPTPPSQTKN